MEANFQPSYNVQTLTEIFLRDTSIYDSANPISSIDAVRILFGAVPSINGVDTNVTTLYAWNEYVVTSGSIDINGYTYSVGDKIYLANTTTISNQNVTVSQTGYYGQRVTWVPNSGTSVSFTPSQTIANNTSIHYPDYVFVIQYELYGTKIPELTTLTSGTKYIVTGDAGSSITFNGATYYVGEVFTADVTDSFTDASGTNFVCPFVAETTGYMYTWYNNWNLLNSYMEKIANSYSTTGEFNADFVAVFARINAVQQFAEQQFGVSLNGIQNMLNDTLANYQI